MAELYDRVRPSYPDALVDEVLAYSGAVPGDAAAEIGAGTGKATRLFLERGLRVVALEPDREMAAVAVQALAGFSQLTVEQVEFESWQPDRSFQLLFSAQAWHWVRPEVRYVRARDALVEGGGLAVFWNRPAWDRTPLRDDLDAVYARYVPDAGAKPGPMNPGSVRPEHWMTDWDRDLGQEAGLGELEHASYLWNVRYTTREYVDLLQTHSDHIVIDADRRQGLLDGVAEVIDAHGGAFELPYMTRLLMARALR